jgi:hypothetical protein
MLKGSFVTVKVRPHVEDGGDDLKIWRVDKEYWIRGRGQPKSGDPPAWGLDVCLTTPYSKKKTCFVTKSHEGSRAQPTTSKEGLNPLELVT